MRRLSVLLAICCLFPTSIAFARTWVIQPDSTGDAPTIQAGIDSAAAGDTVMVACGTYYEHDICIKSGVYLTSETGTADCVTINALYDGRVFYAYLDSAASIVGFTATHGYTEWVEGWGGHGGALESEQSELQVINCTFHQNEAGYTGGGAHLHMSSVVFTGCVFSDNEGHGGYGPMEPPGPKEGGGVGCYHSSATFVNCVFLVNRAYSGGGGGAGIHYESTAAFDHCLFVRNYTRVSGGGIAVLGSSFAELTSCTFYRSRSFDDTLASGVHCGLEGSASLDNCIIAFSNLGKALHWDETGAEPVLTCCDLYGNHGGDWVGPIADQYGVNGNISEDPLFCDPERDDFYFAYDSPCLDADTCGTIGAYYGSKCCFALRSIGDVEDDWGGFVSMTWNRICHDYAESDTVVDFYTVWRKVKASQSSSYESVPMPSVLTDPPSEWECVDSVAASGELMYTRSCPTACDSTDEGICWSVFFVRAHCSNPPIEFDTRPDSGYSVYNMAPEGWTDVTTDTLGDTGVGAGLAWVDYDNDGDLDIFVTNTTSEDRLYRNDSLTAESFVEATPRKLEDPEDCRACAWGDYDNDGDLDLYVSKDGPNKLYKNGGSGKFTDVTASPLDDAGIGQTASWADYDNDGDVDLYLVNDGPNKLFRNDDGVFTDVTSGPLGDSRFGMGVGWADYDDDGDQDIYVANYNGANVLLENQGGDVFIDATTPVLEMFWPSAGVAWGDYDNDGDLDLYVTNRSTNWLVRNDGGVFTHVSGTDLDDNYDGRSAAWGDYDLDGDLDLYLVNNNHANRLFRNNGGGNFVRSDSGPSPLADDLPGFSTGWADYDKDGDLDLYLVNDGRNCLFRNDLGPGHHWLEVRLVGVISNSFGQGARVRAVAGGVSQMREIAGASGYLSQGPLAATFGLGTESTVDTLEISWPSGGVQTLTDVACDQSLEIVEEDLSGLLDGTKIPLAFKLYPNRPNPFRTVTAIRYDLPEPALVRLAVYDVSGRLVCTLLDQDLKMPGRHTVYWDGRNEKGRSVSPGIYFCELSAGSYTEIGCMLLVR
jgi:hypothetical protein